MDNNYRHREAHIDFLRIIACLLVIFNHTNERGFLRYISDDLGSFAWGCNLFISIICKSAVPIFFMISGSTLLRKEESLGKTYKRIPKFLIVLILFSFTYFYGDAVISEGGGAFSLCDTINLMIQSNYWHLWYLYAYVAFIITLPFLRKMVILLDVNTSIYLFVLAMLTMGVLPIIEYFLININGQFKPSWITYWIFIFPVLGYVIDVKFDIKRIRYGHIILMWLLNGICFVIGEISEYNFLLRESGSTDERFLRNFCIVNSVTLFLTVKYFLSKTVINDTLYNLIIETGQLTFGIYLMHIWILWKNPFYENWINLERNRVFGKYGGIYIVVALVFVITGGLTWILRHIPIIKWLF